MPNHHKQTFPLSSHRYSVRHLSALPALATNRLIAFIAGTTLAVFLPIFLYEFYDYSITAVLLWYAVLFLCRVPINILAAKTFYKIGLKTSMVIGIFGAIMFYIAGYFLSTIPGTYDYYFQGLAILGLVILIGFYWAPFHIDFAEFQKKEKRGRELAAFYNVQQLIGVLAPLVGGLVIAQYGFHVVFLYAIVVKLIALIPLVFLPKTQVQYEFGFFESYKKMFSKRYRYMTWSMIASGAESIVSEAIWPIFLFVLLAGRYLDVGFVTAIIVIIGLVLQFAIGRQIDKGKVKKLLKWGTGLYSLGWLAKTIVENVLGVFLVSTFHSFGSMLMRLPFDAMFYEKAADSGHYVDEFTVLRETALNFGRLAMVIVLIGVTLILPLAAAFVVAALASLGVNLIAKYHARV